MVCDIMILMLGVDVIPGNLHNLHRFDKLVDGTFYWCWTR